MGKVSGVGIFFIVLIIVLILAFVGWVVFSRMRAQRLGLPPPSLNPFASRQTSGFPTPAPGGIVGWFNGKFRALKNKRSATGAYEGTSYPSEHGATRSRGAFDPDEAWDTRVGNEADMYGPGGYYEEQELGLHAPTAYGGSGYGAPSPGFAPAEFESRGRTRSRDPDERYDHDTGKTAASKNPFGDEAETSNISLRGVSPRPLETDTKSSSHTKNKASKGSLDESPTERRSMFRENM